MGESMACPGTLLTVEAVLEGTARLAQFGAVHLLGGQDAVQHQAEEVVGDEPAGDLPAGEPANAILWPRITELAPAVMWIWEDTPNIRSANVNGVVDADNAMWSYAHTSLK